MAGGLNVTTAESELTEPLFDVDEVFPDAWLYRSDPFAAASITQPDA
jgi:hypothetical protein